MCDVCEFVNDELILAGYWKVWEAVETDAAPAALWTTACC